ncbi:MAG: zinc-ribbon domain-containing protein [Lachnospirales bacterium]
MYCRKCGEQISEDSVFCPKCGTSTNIDVSNENVVKAIEPKEINEDIFINETTLNENKKSKKPIIFSLVGVVALICVIIFSFSIYNDIQEERLEKALENKWYISDNSITKVLDIDDDTLEYRIETGFSFLDTSMGTFKWETDGKNKIKIKLYDNYKTYTVDINDKGDVLTISPALTDNSQSETWYLAKK